MASLLTTPQEILSILASNPGNSYYINELIRLTGKYPNSVQQALNRLEKMKLVTKSKHGNRIFYQISSTAAPVVTTTFSLPQPHQWVKLLNRPTFLAFNYIVCKSNRDVLPKIYGVSVPSFWLNGQTFGVYYLKNELEVLGKTIAGILNTQPRFAVQDIQFCRRTAKELTTYTQKLTQTDVKKLENAALIQEFKSFLSKYEALFPFITTPHAIERYFEAKIREQVGDEKILQLLLSPATLFDEERDSALNIAAHVKAFGKDATYHKLIERHWRSFCWLPMWTLTSQPMTKTQFEVEVDDLGQRITDPEAERALIIQADRERVQAIEQALKSSSANDILRQQVLLLQEYINLRTFRKNVLCRAHYEVLPLLHEIANRLSLTFTQLNHLSFDELFDGLRHKRSYSALQTLANSRQNGWGILMWKGEIIYPSGIGKVVKTMEQYRIIQPSPLASPRIVGRTASKGKAIGKAKIIHHLDELDKVKSGDILVTKMTTPDFVIAMNRCGGIVTDEGGVTCHAAIVSRELGVPCVIATHIATQQLQDDDLVELNADGGYVRVLEKKVAATSAGRLTGKCVYEGKIKGKVKVIFDVNDLSQVNHGNILVTAQVTPEYLSCLYRVGGIIVEEDSLTSHTVLYANALKIPTIMATQSAKTILYDGQEIVLDATKGVVTVVGTSKVR